LPQAGRYANRLIHNEEDKAIGFDFSHEYKGKSSKHIPFDWKVGS